MAAQAADIEERLESGSGSGPRGGGRGGKRGGKRGGGAPGTENREVAVSKALSKLLRHAAGDAGLTLDTEGFARVDQVMQWPRLKSLKITFKDIQEAVSDNAKQRFSMKPNPSLAADKQPSLDSSDPSDWVIRANQGHSIKTVSSEALLTPITLEANNVPEVVVHGTYFAFYEAIVQSGGLKKMTRNHIHCSTGIPGEDTAVKSGMRNDAEILIYIDIQKCLADAQGIKWWMSENGVVLTEGDEQGLVPTKFWKTVVGKRQEIGTLWRDGECVGQLPDVFKNRRPPMGKGRGGGRGGRGGAGRGRGRGRGGRDSHDPENTQGGSEQPQIPI
ncbi:tRNA 2-phosphotransferase 1 [Phlyctema vagabunda]|uniref:2'-phosphotransferase n=1 Tax=Phlyctema vagabunda TaxID=108571 RepID=A0ABR4PRJ0_9HELO